MGQRTRLFHPRRLPEGDRSACRIGPRAAEPLVYSSVVGRRVCPHRSRREGNASAHYIRVKLQALRSQSHHPVLPGTAVQKSDAAGGIGGDAEGPTKSGIEVAARANSILAQNAPTGTHPRLARFGQDDAPKNAPAAKLGRLDLGPTTVPMRTDIAH